MANALFGTGLKAFMDADIDYLVDTIKVQLVDADYVFSAAHDFFDDVPAGAKIGTAGALASKTSTGGVADAADQVFTAVVAGDTVTGLVIYKDTGVAGTSALIAFFDTKADSSAISVATNGGNITVIWSASGIFRI